MSIFDYDPAPAENHADQPVHREIRVQDVIDPNEGEVTFYSLQDGQNDQAWITIESEHAVSLEDAR